jgi:hypothetical protein
MEESKKPIIRKSDLIMLLICAILIGYVLVDQGGCYGLKRTERLEWVD